MRWWTSGIVSRHAGYLNELAPLPTRVLERAFLEIGCMDVVKHAPKEVLQARGVGASQTRPVNCLERTRCLYSC